MYRISLWTLALINLLAALTLGCESRGPRIIEAQLSPSRAAEGLTPLGASLLVQSGSAPLSATLLLGLSTGDLNASDCPSSLTLRGRGHRASGSIFPEVGGGTEAGAEVSAEREARCVSAPLTLVSVEEGPEPLTSFSGQAHFGPHLTGELLVYAFEVRDADGRLARFPAEGAGSLVIGEPNAPVSIDQLTPRAGPSSLSAPILIKGEGFTRASTMRLTLGGRPLERVSVESSHLISAYAPSGPARSYGELIIERAGHSARLSEAYYWRPPPTISSLSPAYAPIHEPTLVLLEVDELSLSGPVTPELLIDGVSVTPREGPLSELRATTLSEQERARGVSVVLSVEVPAGEAGLVTLSVRGADGQEASAQLERLHAPTLSSITPERGLDAPSQWVLLRGEHLKRPGAVWFGEREALSVETSDDGTYARVLTPLHPGGLSDVRYVNPDGQWGELLGGYRFIGPPLIEGASPPEVTRCGGGEATLLGRNFEPEMRVFLNGLEVEVLSVNDEGTSARIRAPEGEAGPIEVVILSPEGRDTSNSEVLSYGTQAVVRQIEPAEAPVWGGTTSLVYGSDLEVPGQLFVGGEPVERARLLRGGCEALIEVTLPPRDEGEYTLTFEGRAGERSELPEAVRYVAPSFEPSEGLAAGYTNLTLRGLDLREGMSLTFEGLPPRELTRLSDEEWRVLTPATAFGRLVVELRNVDGRGLTSQELYRVNSLVTEPDEPFRAPGDCNDARAADLNGDGYDDLALAMGSSSPSGVLNQQDLIFFGGANGRLTLQSNALPAGLVGNGMNVKAGDLDSDGDLDLLFVNLFSERNFLLLNDGAGRFREDLAFSFSEPSYDAELFDADGDGDLDLFFMQTGDVAENAQEGPERLFLNELGASPRWLERSEGIDFDLDDVHDHDMKHLDLNEDGLDDVIIVVDNLPQSFPGASNRLLLNRGGGVFERVESPINNYPGDWLDVASGDLNGDGHVDVILPQDYIEGVSVPNTPPVALFFGDGQGGLTDESFRVHGMPPAPAFGATPLDLDADGDLDLMISVFGLSYADGTIDAFQSVLLLNDGRGDLYEANASFRDVVPLSPSAHFEPVDLERDGRLDMLECAAEGASRLWRQQQEP